LLDRMPEYGRSYRRDVGRERRGILKFESRGKEFGLDTRNLIGGRVVRMLRS